MANTPLTIRIPIRGKVLVKLDGFDALHEVGAFTKELDVSVSTAGGNVDFRFDEKFWEEAIRDRGVEPPTPTDSFAAGRAALPVIQEVLEAHTQSARNHSCECGWRPKDTSIMNTAGMQHRRHLAAELVNAGLSA